MKKQKVQAVKKVITGLKKASKLHAGQAKVLKKVITPKKMADGGLSKAAGYSPVMGNNKFGYPSGGIPVKKG